jgi:hypothetical protein
VRGTAARAGLIAALFLGTARADDVARSWETLQDARLVEAADGTPAVAAAYYEELLSNMQPGDPLYGQTCYWLGRARYALGDADGAIAALREAAKDGATRPKADALLSRIEMEVRRVRKLPVTLGFETGIGVFVRAGETSDRGGLEVRSADGNAVLAWNTTVTDDGEDRIRAAFEPGSELEHIAFRVRTTAFPARVALVLSDGAGGTVRGAGIDVPVGEWVSVDVPVSAFSGGKGRRAVRYLEIVDVTASAGTDRGVNTLLFDDVELR